MVRLVKEEGVKTMKLRNKKTGEIVELLAKPSFVKRNDDYLQSEVNTFNSLAELNAEWEDAPEEPKEWYWFIEDNGIMQRSCHYEDLHPTLDKARKEIGNYFETKEEAEKAVEKLKAWKRLKDKGVSFEFTVIDRKWYLKPKAEKQQRTFDEVHDLFKDVKIVFGGEE